MTEENPIGAKRHYEQELERGGVKRASSENDQTNGTAKTASKLLADLPASNLDAAVTALVAKISMHMSRLHCTHLCADSMLDLVNATKWCANWAPPESDHDMMTRVSRAPLTLSVDMHKTAPYLLRILARLALRAAEQAEGGMREAEQVLIQLEGGRK